MNLNTKEIYLAGGCFWGVEAFFKKVYGIIDIKVGIRMMRRIFLTLY